MRHCIDADPGLCRGNVEKKHRGVNSLTCVIFLSHWNGIWSKRLVPTGFDPSYVFVGIASVGSALVSCSRIPRIRRSAPTQGRLISSSDEFGDQGSVPRRQIRRPKSVGGKRNAPGATHRSSSLLRPVSKGTHPVDPAPVCSPRARFAPSEPLPPNEDPDATFGHRVELRLTEHP